MIKFNGDVVNHTNCKGQLHIRPSMFMTHDVIASGIVCTDCNGLWLNPDDNFIERVKNARI